MIAKQRAWFVWRAVLAIGLMAGFYAFAFAIAAALVYTPHALWAYVEWNPFRLIAFCYAAAAAIVWAVLPRPDRFTPPGPLLTPTDQPRLFSVLSGVARATGQEMPSEVYAVDDVAAWVTNRGGIMGFGSRRVMALGLPLLQALSVEQFRAALAHEFGHYHAGDVALGPWIHKTRSAIARAIHDLREDRLRHVFEWYGRLFLRATQAISRRQEFIADQMAASVIGSQALADGLVRAQLAEVQHLHFMLGEVCNVLYAGFLPPLTAGFGTFLRSPAVRARLSQALDANLSSEETEKADVYASHPTLRERLAAMGVEAPHAGDVDTPAITLLDQVEHLDRMLIETKRGPTRATLRSIEWNEVWQHVHLPRWKADVTSSRDALAAWSPTTLPSGKEAFAVLGSQLLNCGDDADSVDFDWRVAHAVYVVGAALAVTANAEGFELHGSPGAEVRLTRHGDSFEPFTIAQALFAGTLSAEDWRPECARLGLASAPWSAVTPPAPALSSAVAGLAADTRERHINQPSETR
jgi:heat shock protein HtpX